MAEFVRHHVKGNVEVIHRWGCGSVEQMTRPLPWNWAEGRAPEQWLRLGWFRPCQKCCPDLARFYFALEEARADPAHPWHERLSERESDEA